GELWRNRASSAWPRPAGRGMLVPGRGRSEWPHTASGAEEQHDGHPRRLPRGGAARRPAPVRVGRDGPPAPPPPARASSPVGGKRMPTVDTAVTPDPILQLGFGFWGSKAVLSAVELGLFTALAPGPLDGEALRERLGLHPRGARDFFDALVA